MAPRETMIEFTPPAPLLGTPWSFWLFADHLICRKAGRERNLPLGSLTVIHLDTSRPSHPVLRLRMQNGHVLAIRSGRSDSDKTAFRTFALSLIQRSGWCNPFLRHAQGASTLRWLFALTGAIATLGVMIGVGYAALSRGGLDTVLLPLAVVPLAFAGALPVLQEGPERVSSCYDLRSALSQFGAQSG